MEYALIIREGADDFAARTDPNRSAAYWDSWKVYAEAIGASGKMRGGSALQDPGTTTTIRNGHVQDGPYADAKEQLGGFFIIEAVDLDEALQWARRVPVTATGCVEVRPVLPMR